MFKKIKDGIWQDKQKFLLSENNEDLKNDYKEIKQVKTMCWKKYKAMD